MSKPNKFTNSQLTVELGSQKYLLNGVLATEKKISFTAMRKIILLHIEKIKLFEKMEATDDVVRLKALAQLVECIECDLQKLWKLPVDIKYHEWYRVPKCKCPTMDNHDRKGTNHCIISGDCPIHGGIPLSEEWEATYTFPKEKPLPRPCERNINTSKGTFYPTDFQEWSGDIALFAKAVQQFDDTKDVKAIAEAVHDSWAKFIESC